MSEEEQVEEVVEQPEVIKPVERHVNLAYGYSYVKEEKQFYRTTIEFNSKGEAKVISVEKAGTTRPLASFDANKTFTRQIMNINML